MPGTAALHEEDLSEDLIAQLVLDNLKQIIDQADNVETMILVVRTKDGYEDGAMIGDAIELYKMCSRMAQISRDGAARIISEGKIEGLKHIDQIEIEAIPLSETPPLH